MDECHTGAAYSQVHWMKVSHLWRRSSWDALKDFDLVSMKTFIPHFEINFLILPNHFWLSLITTNRFTPVAHVESLSPIVRLLNLISVHFLVWTMPTLALGWGHLVTGCCFALVYVQVQMSWCPHICKSLCVEYYPYLLVSGTMMGWSLFLVGQWRLVSLDVLLYAQVLWGVEVDKGGDLFHPAFLKFQGNHFHNQGGVIDEIECFLVNGDSGHLQSLVYVCSGIIDQVNKVVDSGASFGVSRLAMI